MAVSSEIEASLKKNSPPKRGRIFMSSATIGERGMKVFAINSSPRPDSIGTFLSIMQYGFNPAGAAGDHEVLLKLEGWLDR